MRSSQLTKTRPTMPSGELSCLNKSKKKLHFILNQPQAVNGRSNMDRENI